MGKFLVSPVTVPKRFRILIPPLLKLASTVRRCNRLFSVPLCSGSRMLSSRENFHFALPQSHHPYLSPSHSEFAGRRGRLSSVAPPAIISSLQMGVTVRASHAKPQLTAWLALWEKR